MEGIEWDLQLKMRDYYITRSASEFFKKWLLLDFYGKLLEREKENDRNREPTNILAPDSFRSRWLAHVSH